MNNSSAKHSSGGDMSTENFNVRVESVIEVIDDNTRQEYAELKILFNNGSSTVKELLLSDIGSIKWSKLDPKCIVNRESETEIEKKIRMQLSDNPPRKKRYVLDKDGLYVIDNTIVFVAGDRVFTRSSDNNVPVELANKSKRHRLDIDESIDLKKAFEGLAELIALAPGVGWVLLAYTISGIIRRAYVDAGLTPNNVLMIVGKSGMHKSTYVPLITQLYDRGTEIKANTRFNSSDSFIEDLLCENRHCTYVIDDIHTGSSSSIKRKNETTAEEIVRRISDNTGRGRKDGKKSRQMDFECNVVFIGEYLIGAESTAARMLCAELTHEIDGTVMDKYQRSEKLLVSTFYSYFIQWYVEKYQDIRETINSRFTRFRSSGSRLPVHGRLADTLFYLHVSQIILLDFFIEHDLMTKENAIDISQRFQMYVLGLIKEQQNRFKSQDDSSEEVNYLSIIKELYQAGDFKLAKNKTKFDDDVHDGVIHYECLCLRGKSLKRVVKQKFGSSNLKPLTDYLRSLKALKLDSDGGPTVQINGLKGKRFYAIWLKKLNLR